MKPNKSVIVIGGGAAGIIAAISARRAGADVTILERNPRIGKKILVTGNGRCNFTNVNIEPKHYYDRNPKFVNSILSGFTVDDTINFFEGLGIQHKVEDLGKIFPMSEQASSFLDVFLYELDKIGVQVICNAYVKSIFAKGHKFKIELASGKLFWGDRVIVTTGGKAMPASGSDGNGYDLVTKFGHNIIKIFPALVQLMLEGPFFKRISGVKFIGTAKIVHNNKEVIGDRGDILFANYGVSGPPILQISRKAGELLKEGEDVYLKIAVIDTMTRSELRELINRRFQICPKKTVEFSFVGLINKRLIPVILTEAGIKDLKFPAARISVEKREKIIEILTGWKFKIKSTRSWPSAQVTAGGVDTGQINSRTLESKLVKGLFFAGEIIDIDGQCGGYNLQWAWSSGFIAGKNGAL